MKKVATGSGIYRISGNEMVLTYFSKLGIAKIPPLKAPLKCTIKEAEALVDNMSLLKGMEHVTPNPRGPANASHLREVLYRRMGVKECFCCGELLEEFEDATLEHIIPLSLGGGNKYINYSLSHKICNIKRGNTL